MRQSATKTEQLTSRNNVKLDYDQPLSTKDILKKVCSLLGKKSKITKISNRDVVIYKHGNITECFIVKPITYLGKPHPLYKKRIQLDSSINEFYEENKGNGYNIRLLGLYHYKGVYIFADFDKTQYLERNLHNSSAHVMVNDLYQARIYGIFSKYDMRNNKITTITSKKFKKYIDTALIQINPIFELFNEFNKSLDFGTWIKADTAISVMKKDSWWGWRNCEWAGMYLEYLMKNFIDKEKCSDIIFYKGNVKNNNTLDFDLIFNADEFYGDLKASNSAEKECLANDQTNFIKAVTNYDRFWYVVYEHDTIKDKDKNNEMAIKRMNLIGNTYVPGGHISYKTRMKHSIYFNKMYIIELNRVNYHSVLKVFNQGHQYHSNVSRAPKFKIDKKSIDNYIVYSKTF